jgi:hypothetical protein
MLYYLLKQKQMLYLTQAQTLSLASESSLSPIILNMYESYRKYGPTLNSKMK